LPVDGVLHHRVERWNQPATHRRHRLARKETIDLRFELIDLGIGHGRSYSVGSDPNIGSVALARKKDGRRNGFFASHR
jgi:hypothetical protein